MLTLTPRQRSCRAVPTVSFCKRLQIRLPGTWCFFWYGRRVRGPLTCLAAAHLVSHSIEKQKVAWMVARHACHTVDLIGKIMAHSSRATRARVFVNFRKFAWRARRARAGLTVYPGSGTLPPLVIGHAMGHAIENQNSDFVTP